MRKTVRLSFIFALVVTLVNCGGQDGDSSAGLSDSNSPPVITGNPGTIASQGAVYSFEPMVSDIDNDRLSFSIAGRPPWADFDGRNGALTGQPGPGDLGTYASIVIGVGDGQAIAALPAFDIKVVTGEATASVTLAWTVPTHNKNGTPLTDLAGFKIYYGMTVDDYPYFDTINDPRVETHTVDNLAPGEWFFAVTAVDASLHESRFSDLVSTIIE